MDLEGELLLFDGRDDGSSGVELVEELGLFLSKSGGDELFLGELMSVGCAEVGVDGTEEGEFVLTLVVVGLFGLVGG